MITRFRGKVGALIYDAAPTIRADVSYVASLRLAVCLEGKLLPPPSSRLNLTEALCTWRKRRTED